MDNIFIDGNTGEIFNDIHHIVTNEQHEKYVEHKKIQQELQEKKDRINTNYKEYGAFIWFLYNYNDVIDLGVPPDMLTKLIYVSTFMDYKNRIMIADNKCMNRQQMQALLNISDVTFWRFLTITAEANIMTEEDNVFYLNADIFERGIIKTFNKSRIRLYAKGIRYVYHKAKVTEHRLLSYL